MRKIIITCTVLLLSGCVKIKPEHSTVFVLHKCITIESLVVNNNNGNYDHEELTCECPKMVQKLDGKTGKTIIECQ